MAAYGLALTRLAAPATEPVGLSEMKEHLRVTFSSDDSEIRAMTSAARRAAEEEMGESFVSQQWRWDLENWWRGVLELPMGPVIAVDSITYQDSDDAQQTFSADSYRLDPSRSLLEYVGNPALPELTADYGLGRIKITYTAGEATAAAVHEAVKHAIKLYVGDLYLNRETMGPPAEGTLETFRQLIRSARRDYL